MISENNDQQIKLMHSYALVWDKNVTRYLHHALRDPKAQWAFKRSPVPQCWEVEQ